MHAHVKRGHGTLAIMVHCASSVAVLEARELYVAGFGAGGAAEGFAGEDVLWLAVGDGGLAGE